MPFQLSLEVLLSPRSQGRLLRVHAATKDGRCVSCMRVPQQRWSLKLALANPCFYVLEKPHVPG